MLGATVFMLLDAPSLRTMSGAKSVVVLWCSTSCCARCVFPVPRCGRNLIPKMKRGRSPRILKPEIDATEQGKAEELIARAKALDEQVKALEVRLKALGGDPGDEGCR